MCRIEIIYFNNGFHLFRILLINITDTSFILIAMSSFVSVKNAVNCTTKSITSSTFEKVKFSDWKSKKAFFFIEKSSKMLEKSNQWKHLDVVFSSLEMISGNFSENFNLIPRSSTDIVGEVIQNKWPASIWIFL